MESLHLPVGVRCIPATGGAAQCRPICFKRWSCGLTKQSLEKQSYLSTSILQVLADCGVSVHAPRLILWRGGDAFTKLLAEVRHEAALDWLELGEGSLGELSVSLGYAHPSALTRAFRRWSKASPSELSQQ